MLFSSVTSWPVCLFVCLFCPNLSRAVQIKTGQPICLFYVLFCLILFNSETCQLVRFSVSFCSILRLINQSFSLSHSVQFWDWSTSSFLSLILFNSETDQPVFFSVWFCSILRLVNQFFSVSFCSILRLFNQFFSLPGSVHLVFSGFQENV